MRSALPCLRALAIALTALSSALPAPGVARADVPAATPPPPEAIGQRPHHVVADPGAVDFALRCVCQSFPPGRARERCVDERRADVPEIVSDLLWLAQLHDMPDWFWPWLVAQGCRESRLLNDPPGHNDNGTSGGMFQLKKVLWGRWYHERFGTALDVYDHVQAADFVLRRIKSGVRVSVPAACGVQNVKKRFALAAYRFGRGPLVDGSPRRPVERCRPAPDGGQQCTIVKPIQRCSGEPVAVRWAASWFRQCPECWRLMDAREAAYSGPRRGYPALDR